MKTKVATAGGWRQEADDIIRGMAGGLLIGTPLIFTMETWIIGGQISPLLVLALLAVTYVLNLGCLIWSGFRRGSGHGGRLLADALDATALAIISAALLLALLNQIQLDTPLNAICGRLVLAAIPVSLGIAVANHLISRDSSRTAANPDEEDNQPPGGASGTLPQTLLDLGATAAGALFFCFNIAPTDEVRLLVTELPNLYLPAIIAASLLISYAIVFIADFGNQSARQASRGMLQHPPTETVAAYVVSLLVAAGALWVFGQIGPGVDWWLVYAQVIVLGLPAAIGGAAGRLAV